MKNKLITTIFIMLIATGTLFSIETSTIFGSVGAYYFDDNKGFGLNDGSFAPISYTPKPAPTDADRALGSGWGGIEIQTSLTHNIKVPFLQGTGALTSGNNLLFQLKGELSPVTMNGVISATITPIAFLNFQAGTSIGTGWNFFDLFNGLGLNNDGTGNPQDTSIPGVVSKSWVSGTFQFDTGAVFPGKWNHVIMAATAKVKHEYFNKAKAEEPWWYEGGDHFNGFSYLGSYVLGYKLPFKLDTVAFLVETKQMIGSNKEMSTMDSTGGWGSDFIQVTFGPLANIKLSESSSLIILVQLRTEKLFTEATIYENYFPDRDYSGTYIDFSRIAFSYTHKL